MIWLVAACSFFGGIAVVGSLHESDKGDVISALKLAVAAVVNLAAAAFLAWQMGA